MAAKRGAKQQTVHYKAVRAVDIVDLEKDVQMYLNDGYECQGGLCVVAVNFNNVSRLTGVSEYSGESLVFIQVVVKYD